MNTKEAREIIIKYVFEFMISMGYDLYKTDKTQALFKRKTNLGFDRIGISTLNFNPYQQLGFGLSKRINIVEDIITELSKKVALSTGIDKRHTVTLSYSYNIIYGEHGYDSNRGNDYSISMNDCKTEEEMKIYIKYMINFLEKYGIPILDKFEDLREIDRIINGEEFWEEDWNSSFNLGGNFHEKRIIIAKLVSNPNYNEIVKMTKAIQASYEDQTYVTNSLELLTQMLEDIKPIPKEDFPNTEYIDIDILAMRKLPKEQKLNLIRELFKKKELEKEETKTSFWKKIFK